MKHQTILGLCALALSLSACNSKASIDSNGNFTVQSAGYNEEPKSKAEMLVGTWVVDLPATVGSLDAYNAKAKEAQSGELGAMALVFFESKYVFTQNTFKLDIPANLLKIVGSDPKMEKGFPYTLKEDKYIKGSEQDDFDFEILEISPNKLVLDPTHQGVSMILTSGFNVDKIVLKKAE